MKTAVIILIVLAVGWLVLVLVNPVHRCPACKGAKSVPHGNRRSPCQECNCTGKTYRRGAVFVHSLVREHAWPWLHARIVDRIGERLKDFPEDTP